MRLINRLLSLSLSLSLPAAVSRHVARHHYSVKTCRLLCRKKRSEKAAKRRQSRYGWDAENFYENGPKTKTGNVLFFASSRMSMRPTPHLVLLTRLSGTSRRPLGAISKWSRTQHKRKAGPRDGDRHAIKQRAPIRSTLHMTDTSSLLFLSPPSEMGEMQRM